jgi:predicted ABC-type ATPase
VARQKVPSAVVNPQIFVLAGCNGAGKSSVGGQAFQAAGIPYFNPDLAAREAILAAAAVGRAMTQREANAWAWNEGVARLRRAIAERGNYALETTLGGDTIVRLLFDAATAGLGVNVWFVGLDSVELHVARVRQRVARGGHDIPRADVERRYIRGRVNLIRLLPKLSQLVVYDNSAQADADAPTRVAPRLLLRSVGGVITGPSDLSQTPAWAKPIIAAALKVDRSRRGKKRDGPPRSAFRHATERARGPAAARLRRADRSTKEMIGPPDRPLKN